MQATNSVAAPLAVWTGKIFWLPPMERHIYGIIVAQKEKNRPPAQIVGWGKGMSWMDTYKNLLVNREALQHLLENVHTLTGIWVTVLDVEGKVLLAEQNSPFCRMLSQTEEGAARCAFCAERALQACGCMGNQGIFTVTCHAGLQKSLLPIYEDGVPVAYLSFGELREDLSIRRQWEKVRQSLDWYGEAKEPLMQAFFALGQHTQEKSAAFAEMLQVLAGHIQREGLIRTAEYTDAQRLQMYLDAHYMEPLTLHGISEELHMGTTKLCTLARKISGGKTVTQLIASRRIRAAKQILISRSSSISEVAEQVGFSDYNYFTRIFKQHTGMTPRAYRKQSLPQLSKK